MLFHHRGVAPGVGLEPTPFLINSQAGYRLPDPGMEPARRIALPFPVYGTGVLAVELRRHEKSWSPRPDSHRLRSVLQTDAASPLASRAMAPAYAHALRRFGGHSEALEESEGVESARVERATPDCGWTV